VKWLGWCAIRADLVCWYAWTGYHSFWSSPVVPILSLGASAHPN